MLFVAVEIPLRAAGYYEPSLATALVDGAVTLVFALEIVVKLRTARFVDGRLVQHPGQLARLYARGGLAVDLAALLGHVVLLGDYRWLWLLRIIKVVQLPGKVRTWEGVSTMHPVWFRAPFFIGGVVLLSHWAACGWTVIAGPGARDPAGYVGCLHWAVTILTTVGNSETTPAEPVAKIYMIVVMLLGVGMYAYIIGVIARLVTESDHAWIRHKDRLERAQSFMRNHKMPAELRKRVQEHYRYRWDSQRGFDETDLNEDLPPAVRVDVAMFLLGGMLRSVPIFKNADYELLRNLAVNLRPVVYGPGEIIMTAGDQATCMFFIRHGTVQVLDAGERIVATLGAGDHFGEIALLGEGRRTATVRATEFCDLYLLDQDRFEQALETSPLFAAEIDRIAKDRAAEGRSPEAPSGP